MKLNVRNDVIWLTRGRDWGFRFLSAGPFTNDEAISVRDQAFSSCEDIPCSVSGRIIKNGMGAYRFYAQRFYDPSRRDAAGRRIIHEIIAVSRIRDLECGTDPIAFCLSVKSYYDRIFYIESETVVPVDDAVCVDFNVAETKGIEKRDVVINDTDRECVSANKYEWCSPFRFGGILIVTIALGVGAAIALRQHPSSGDERVADRGFAEVLCEKKSMPTSVTNAVARKIQKCEFLLNEKFKMDAKVYLCLFSASWCPPCRAEMPRIVKIYAETLQSDPDVELIHFSCDQDDGKALLWLKELGVKFPVVKPKGEKPIGLHASSIPHLFVLMADGRIIEEGHPAKLLAEDKLRHFKR